jgi:hypothetical protein
MPATFKVKVEMRQIGIRQEAAKVGGIGSCGRELCCSTWLNDFKSVNTTAARYQNLSINQTKLSGQCGRLKCCLNYELDTYLDALQQFPDYAETLDTMMGPAQLIKKDIFKNLMWYVLPNNSKHYPLSIQRVKDIKRMNQQGQKADELQPVDVTANKAKETESGFVDLVGQISLRTLEKNDRRRKDQQRNERSGREPARAINLNLTRDHASRAEDKADNRASVRKATGHRRAGVTRDQDSRADRDKDHPATRVQDNKADRVKDRRVTGHQVVTRDRGTRVGKDHRVRSHRNNRRHQKKINSFVNRRRTEEKKGS